MKLNRGVISRHEFFPAFHLQLGNEASWIHAFHSTGLHATPGKQKRTWGIIGNEALFLNIKTEVNKIVGCKGIPQSGIPQQA
jgi:hypothetical protein